MATRNIAKVTFYANELRAIAEAIVKGDHKFVHEAVRSGTGKVILNEGMSTALANELQASYGDEKGLYFKYAPAEHDTLLHLAAGSLNPNRAIIIRDLLEAGANPNIQTISGDTALHIAISRRDNLTVPKLYEVTNREIKNWTERNAAEYMISNGYTPDELRDIPGALEACNQVRENRGQSRMATTFTILASKEQSSVNGRA